jgi:thymidylate synthase
MFESYIDLLNTVASDGELIQPSDVSLNRSFATKELNNV